MANCSCGHDHEDGFACAWTGPDGRRCFCTLSNSSQSARINPPPAKGAVEVHSLVASDVISRAHYGKIKYGTFLETFNGRSALQDAYEECMDLACYLKQRILEEESMRDDDQLYWEDVLKDEERGRSACD